MHAAATLAGVAEACAALGDRLARELAAAADVGAQVVAAQARAGHWFENRTGDAEASTQAIEHAGAWVAGTLTFGVEIGVEYGSYLDERAPVLERAFRDVEDQLGRALDAGLGDAARSTPGWRAG